MITLDLKISSLVSSFISEAQLDQLIDPNRLDYTASVGFLITSASVTVTTTEAANGTVLGAIEHPQSNALNGSAADRNLSVEKARSKKYRTILPRLFPMATSRR